MRPASGPVRCGRPAPRLPAQSGQGMPSSIRSLGRPRGQALAPAGTVQHRGDRPRRPFPAGQLLSNLADSPSDADLASGVYLRSLAPRRVGGAFGPARCLNLNNGLREAIQVMSWAAQLARTIGISPNRTRALVPSANASPRPCVSHPLCRRSAFSRPLGPALDIRRPREALSCPNARTLSGGPSIDLTHGPLSQELVQTPHGASAWG